MSSTPRNREQVYCHQCEREWYRDEHGLTCPTCHSDFVEIIEQDTTDDPRDDLHIDNLGDLAIDPPIWDPEDHPSLHQHGHERPQQPGEWRTVGPTYTVRNTFQHPQPEGGNTGTNDAQNTTSPIGGLLGGIFGMMTGATPAQTQNNNGTRSWSYISPSGNAHFSITTSTTGSFGPGPPRPGMEGGPEHPFAHLNQLFTVFGGPGSPTGPRGFDNNAIFDILMNGQMGNHARSQEDFDRIITQIMEQQQGNQGPPAATEDAIESLPKKSIDKAMLGDTGKAECTICMAEVDLGEVVTELYCKHWFHTDCIKVWLEQHNTCPHCRKSIEEGKQEAISRGDKIPSEASSSGPRPASPSHAHPPPPPSHLSSPFMHSSTFQTHTPPVPGPHTRPSGPGHSASSASTWLYSNRHNSPSYTSVAQNPSAPSSHNPSFRRQSSYNESGERRSRSGDPVRLSNITRERSYDRRDYERRRRSGDMRERRRREEDGAADGEEEEQPGLLQRARDWVMGHGSNGSGGSSGSGGQGHSHGYSHGHGHGHGRS